MSPFSRGIIEFNVNSMEILYCGAQTQHTWLERLNIRVHYSDFIQACSPWAFHVGIEKIVFILSELLHEVMKDRVFKRCANIVLKTPALLGSVRFIQTKKSKGFCWKTSQKTQWDKLIIISVSSIHAVQRTIKRLIWLKQWKAAKNKTRKQPKTCMSDLVKCQITLKQRRLFLVCVNFTPHNHNVAQLINVLNI